MDQRSPQLARPALGGLCLQSRFPEGWDWTLLSLWFQSQVLRGEVLSMVVLLAKGRARTDPGLTPKPVLFKFKGKIEKPDSDRHFLA